MFRHKQHWKAGDFFEMALVSGGRQGRSVLIHQPSWLFVASGVLLSPCFHFCNIKVFLIIRIKMFMK